MLLRPQDLRKTSHSKVKVRYIDVSLSVGRFIPNLTRLLDPGTCSLLNLIRIELNKNAPLTMLCKPSTYSELS